MKLLNTFFTYFLTISTALFSICPTDASVNTGCIRLSWDPLFAVVRDLQEQNLLDGEVLMALGDKIIIHQRSQDIDTLEEPQFMIASLSKQFFAVALLKALYDGSSEETEEAKIRDVKIKLHLPLSHYLSYDSPLWKNKTPSWIEQVSLHQLLNHTSGITNYTDTLEFSSQTTPDKKFFELPHSPEELIELIAGKELQFTPGTQFSYSNTGYLLIAEVIEGLTKKPVGDYLNESIFIPLGLSSTSHASQGNWAELKQQEKYLHLVPQWNFDPTGIQSGIYSPQDNEDISMAKGAGSIISTAFDLLKWNRALHQTDLLLPKELYQLLVQPGLDNYAYGIGVEDSRWGPFYGHLGGIGTYRTFLGYFPEQEISFIILSHISVDFEKIKGELEQLALSLTEVEESHRIQKAWEMLEAKYPTHRGFIKVKDVFEQLIK